MLRNVFFAALPWLMLSRSVVMGKALPQLNSTLATEVSQSKPPASAGASCFPALDFKMPTTVPSSLKGWWCHSDMEYAFVGFSYEITQCTPGHVSMFTGSHSCLYRPKQEQTKLGVCRYPETIQRAIYPLVRGLRSRRILVSRSMVHHVRYLIPRQR